MIRHPIYGKIKNGNQTTNQINDVLLHEAPGKQGTIQNQPQTSYKTGTKNHDALWHVPEETSGICGNLTLTWSSAFSCHAPPGFRAQINTSETLNETTETAPGFLFART